MTTSVPQTRCLSRMPGPRYAHRCTNIIILLMMACLLPSSAIGQTSKQKLTVVEQIWGFDGRVQPGQFNPLSILLDNQTDQPIDAMATLQQVEGMLRPTGGLYAQRVFIAPTTRRWIQFYPYVNNHNQTEWRLSFNTGTGPKKLQDFTQPRSAIRTATDSADQPPQMIFLDKASRTTTQPTAIKHLPENIFPPYATATIGLHTVFLDHVPDWEQPRQQAFLSWLKRGGRLHILKDTRGEFPRFSGVLTDINQPFNQYNIGKGIVIRHDVQRNGVSEDMVRRATVVEALQDQDATLQQALESQNFNVHNMMVAEINPATDDQSIFRGMRELTLPQHAWGLIFLLAICYIGMIFPGCYFLSKRSDFHYLATYGAIAGLSVVFSLLFLFIGRRGYGETTTLHTLAVATSEDAQTWNVFQWNTLFVTAGDNYDAGSTDQQMVVAAWADNERADATMEVGSNGKINMRIPPFSSQTFVSRRQMTTAAWNPRVVSFLGGREKLTSLIVQTNKAFPTDADTEYYVLCGRRIHKLHLDTKTQQLKMSATGRALASFCMPAYMQEFDSRDQEAAKKMTAAQRFHADSLPMLVRRSLLDDLVNISARFELPGDQIRLFAYAPVPEDFHPNISASVKRSGRVLFVKDIPLAAPADSQ